MDYGYDYDFSDWFSDDYDFSDWYYIPMEGNTTPDSWDYFDNAGGTYGNWSQGNYDYTYGNTSDYGNDYWNNLNNGVSSGTQDYSGSGNFYGNSPQFQVMPTLPKLDTANPFGSISQTLSSLFNNPQALGLAGKGVAALFEGYQNKKKAEAMKQLAKNPALDPFGSQRQFYQQQAQQAVTNPYDSPIVKAQIEQLQNAQNIKDAAAGRRSNMLTSSPAVMAEMAKIAQNYQQQMAVLGGANIAPSSGLADILSKSTTYDTNGYISPLLTAAGYGVQDNALANLTAEQKKLLGQQWANA